jgi:hypothetical protein
MFFVCLFATVAFPVAAVAKRFRHWGIAQRLGLSLIWLPISALVLASFPAANQITKVDAFHPEQHVDPYSRLSSSLDMCCSTAGGRNSKGSAAGGRFLLSPPIDAVLPFAGSGVKPQG